MNSRHIGSFKIFKRIGLVAYQLELPRDLERIHDVFHVTMLKKYILNPSHILKAPPVWLKEDLSFKVQLVEIMDQRMKKLRNKVILIVKVLWRSNRVEEMTWATKASIRSHYMYLFSD